MASPVVIGCLNGSGLYLARKRCDGVTFWFFICLPLKGYWSWLCGRNGTSNDPLGI